MNGCTILVICRRKAITDQTEDIRHVVKIEVHIVILSTSPFMFMIAWEVMSMASFFLVMSDRSHDSIRAALLYLIMTHLGAAAILIAFLLLAQGSLFVDFSTLADMSWTAPVWMLWTAFSLFFSALVPRPDLCRSMYGFPKRTPPRPVTSPLSCQESC